MDYVELLKGLNHRSDVDLHFTFKKCFSVRSALYSVLAITRVSYSETQDLSCKPQCKAEDDSKVQFYTVFMGNLLCPLL